MPAFIHDDFLLSNPAARELYHTYAKSEPIYDYHCHLPPAQIANNHRFADLAEVWLGGDHYKWRALRTNGVAERFVTGDASPREKFDAWCATVPQTLRNPLYHWSHLELARYFGVTDIINPQSADSIWERANPQLATMRVHDFLTNYKVAVVCTTDDPADSLELHQKIRASGLKTRVYPTFRPDKAFAVGAPAVFNAYMEKLAGAAGGSFAANGIRTFDDFLGALKKRHDDFHAIGGRVSDHGLESALAEPCTHAQAQAVFDAARAGRVPSAEDIARYGSYLMLELGRWDAARGWTKQLHLGNFQDGTIPGKIQFGSGWWFLDQKEAMEWQLNSLSNLGLLSRFVGMLTDSRSFLSYPRHEYFRRTLCNLLGGDIARGEIPNDMGLVGGMVKNICFANARSYFGLELAPEFAAK